MAGPAAGIVQSLTAAPAPGWPVRGFDPANTAHTAALGPAGRAPTAWTFAPGAFVWRPAVGPDGTITVAPQEGEWTPASAIMVAKQGGHYGYGGPKVTPERTLGVDPPLCWIPRGIDNSTGGQAGTGNGALIG